MRRALALGAVAGFLLLAVVAIAWPDNAFDRGITAGLQRWRALDALLDAVSWFGRGPVDVAAPIVAIAALLASRSWLEARFLFASVTGAWLLDHATKLVIRRPRPAWPLRVEEVVHGASFPSGHVVQYVALFGGLALIAWMRVRAPMLRGALVAGYTAIAVLVGPSRVYLGAHWTTDVAAGYALGIAWLAAIAQGLRPAWGRMQKVRAAAADSSAGAGT